MIDSVIEGLLATTPLEAVSVIAGLAYSLLAVRRTRWCWVAGGLSSGILVYLAAQARLPMQAALNVYYVAMSVYGFWNWSRLQAAEKRPVSTWPLWAHGLALLGILLLSAVSSRWLATGTDAAWPFLDSLTTWASLFTTWLVARMKLENWLYWIAIDATLVFLFAERGLMFVALLFLVYVVISIVGLISWTRAYHLQAAQAG